MGSTGIYIQKGLTTSQIRPILEKEVGLKIICHRSGYSWAQGEESAPVEMRNLILGVKWEYHSKTGDLIFKIIDECSGPYRYDCPLSAVEKPFNRSNEYSTKWRASVRVHWALKKERKDMAIVPGLWVAMQDLREFQILAKVSRAYLVSDKDGRRYRLRHGLIDRIVPGPVGLNVGVAS